MTRFSRIRRRPDHWSSAHERARARAAERMDGPLGISEAAWLDAHLAGCVDCAGVAAAYEEERQGLRALREPVPEPPRDLWARTAAAIERESAGADRVSRDARSGQGQKAPAGLLSSVAVVAVVIGATALSGIWSPIQPSPSSADALPSTPIAQGTTGAGASSEIAIAPPTPFAVEAGRVAWVHKGADGLARYGAAAIEEVCPVDGPDGCAVVEDLDTHLTIETQPHTIIGSPTDERAVAVSGDPAGGDRIVVVALPTDPPDGSAPAESSPPASTDPGSAPSPTSPDPSSSTDPSTSDTPSEAPSGSAPAEPADPSPTASTDTADPPASTEPAASPSSEPSPTPSQEAALELAIASGVEVVGQSAAFSPGGDWFAFTARPADGSAGPDIYVWRVGDAKARRITEDGVSVFGSWAGGEIVGSRPGDPSVGAGEPVSVVLDPASGTERGRIVGIWRPVVDGAQERAVAWSGTVAPDAAGTAWSPGDGRLELRPWHPQDAGPDVGQVISAGPLADFDVRWDDTGEWMAVWTQESAEAESGRLSLYYVDPTSGELSSPAGAPEDEPAMAGFSLGDGRLAWATPPGHDGEGSRVQVVAWRDGSVGTVETVPGEEVVVVR